MFFSQNVCGFSVFLWETARKNRNLDELEEKIPQKFADTTENGSIKVGFNPTMLWLNCDAFLEWNPRIYARAARSSTEKLEDWKSIQRTRKSSRKEKTRKNKQNVNKCKKAIILLIYSVQPPAPLLCLPVERMSQVSEFRRQWMKYEECTTENAPSSDSKK